MHVRAEAGARRQEGQAQRRRVEAPLQHALVELDDFDRAALARRAEVRLERNRIERHEAADDLLHLADRAEQADVGPAVRDDRQIPERRARDGAHQRHRLAARPPAADAEGHAVSELGDDVRVGHALVDHGCHAEAFRRQFGVEHVSLSSQPELQTASCLLQAPCPTMANPTRLHFTCASLKGTPDDHYSRARSGYRRGRHRQTSGQRARRQELVRARRHRARARRALGRARARPARRRRGFNAGVDIKETGA